MKSLIYILLAGSLLGCCFGNELDDIEAIDYKSYKYKTQVIEKGKHFVRAKDKFRGIKCINNEVIEITISGEGLRYDIDEDQNDLNKILGRYYNIEPHLRTVMIGWRYNKEADVYEWTPYYHKIKDPEKYRAVGPVPGYIDEGKIIASTIIDGKTTALIKYEYFSCCELITEIRTDQGVVRDTALFDDIGRNYKEGNAYFGGNRKNPDGTLFFEYKFYNN